MPSVPVLWLRGKLLKLGSSNHQVRSRYIKLSQLFPTSSSCQFHCSLYKGQCCACQLSSQVCQNQDVKMSSENTKRLCDHGGSRPYSPHSSSNRAEAWQALAQPSVPGLRTQPALGAPGHILSPQRWLRAYFMPSPAPSTGRKMGANHAVNRTTECLHH